MRTSHWRALLWLSHWRRQSWCTNLMLPLQAHGYLSGLSASPGFLQIRHTSSSSSSSSYFTAAADDDTFASFSESDEDVLTVSADAASFGTSRSADCGGAGAISMDRVRGPSPGGCWSMVPRSAFSNWIWGFGSWEEGDGWVRRFLFRDCPWSSYLCPHAA